MTQPIDRPLLVSGMLSSLLGGLSIRIFLISLPSLANGLEADILAITWALLSYQLANTTSSVVFGGLADTFGHLKIYMLGQITFTAASFLCGISQNVLQLIGFRFLQGIGGAMAQSMGRVLVIEAMPKGSEGRAAALMTVAFHFGIFIGPPIGGFIIEYIGWRWVFFLLVPFGLVAIALAYLRFRVNRDVPSADRSLPFDYIGAGMLVFFTISLILMLDQKSAGILSIEHRSLLLVGSVAGLWLFLVHEHRAKNPIIHLSLFKIKMFSCSMISLVAFSSTIELTGLALPFYLQEILHLSPSMVGLIFVAPAFFTVSLAYVSGQIADRIGPRAPASAGLAVIIAAYLLGATLKIDSHWIVPTIVLALVGIGSAFFTSPNQAAILASPPREHRGFATGILNTTYSLGSLLGISLGGTVLAIAFRYYSGMPAVAPDTANPTAFTSAFNANFLVAVALGLVGLFTSLNSGSAKIQALARNQGGDS